MKSNQIYIRDFTVDDAEALLQLQQDNRSFFEKFSMERENDYYTLDAQTKRIKAFENNRNQDNDYNFGIFKNDDDRLVGTIDLFQVVRGSIQAAFIGYFLDEAHNGKGYTTEAVQLLVNYAFDTLKLHRIEAGVMPHNIGSIRVLEKSGFHKEGIAKKNVKINGKWEDHQVLAIINPLD
ncbi:GNAT family N-acetyltransferase [Virgibacillus oceani]|nr:GNAT family protein [Virgibacillus oceani]